MIIILDSGPLGLIAQRQGLSIAASCRLWIDQHCAAGDIAVVPEIADFEVRRELIRINKTTALARLDAFSTAEPDRYLPITTRAMRRAAEFWADSRKRGLPTADPKELDADVILAAQAVTSGLPLADIVVATTNPAHLSRFVRAELWSSI